MENYMCLFIDKIYADRISSQLELFKWNSDESAATFRCPICGDSQKSKYKTRGGFYTYNNSIMVGCFNCNHTYNNFGSFLKHLDKNLYQQYVIDIMKYKNSIKFEQPIKSEESKEEETANISKTSPLEFLVSLDRLDPFHQAVQYVRNRKIPNTLYNKLFYTSNFKKWINNNIDSSKFQNNFEDEDERIVIPFYDKNGIDYAYSGRYIGKENKKTKRYIIIKREKKSELIYGLDRLDKNKHIYVCEGQFDSMFVDNCLAAAGSSLGKLIKNNIVDDKNLTFIFDNEPRSQEICKLMKNVIDKNKQIVIWPKDIQHKDINEMVQNSIDVETIIKNNTYSGLSALLKFNEWKKVCIAKTI
jgi:transcription elongation factor Elf1